MPRDKTTVRATYPPCLQILKASRRRSYRSARTRYSSPTPILYSDSESLYQAMKRANVPCRLQVSEGMWHVFQMFPMKKASIAMDNVARFLLEQ